MGAFFSAGDHRVLLFHCAYMLKLGVHNSKQQRRYICSRQCSGGQEKECQGQVRAADVSVLSPHSRVLATW